MKLKYFINVFNVWPAFLLPVFFDEEKFFFQKIQSNSIESFVETDLQSFDNSYCFEVSDQINISVNTSAIYSIGFSQSDFIYGDSKAIIDDYRNNYTKYEQDDDFKQTIISFVNKYSTSMTVSNIRNHLIDLKTESVIYPFKQSGLVKKKYFDNDHSILYYNQNLTLAIDDIYLFKKIIDDSIYLKMNYNILYKKHSPNVFSYISFQNQAKIINFVINNQPNVYYKSRDNLSVKKMSTYLWNTDSLYRAFEYYIETTSNLFNRHCGYQRRFWRYLYLRENLEKHIQEILTEWHLKIDKLVFDLPKDINVKENLDDFLDQLSLESGQEESNLYLLNMISLSKKSNINMIVAQSFLNKKAYYFKIKEDSIRIPDIIDFLELLYKEHNKKISIVINDNEIYDNQQFYSWIEDNDDRFSIKSLPFLLGVSM